MIFSDIKHINASSIDDTFSVNLVGPVFSFVSLEEFFFVEEDGIEDQVIPDLELYKLLAVESSSNLRSDP